MANSLSLEETGELQEITSLLLAYSFPQPGTTDPTDFRYFVQSDVPEPGALALFVSALAVVAARAGRRSARQLG